MRKKDLQNDSLEALGRRLFEATRPSAEEIEKIVAASRLFDSVKARIKSDEQTGARPESRLSGTGSKIHIWNWQTAAAVLIVLFAGGGLIFFKSPASEQLTGRIPAPEIHSPAIPAAAAPDFKDGEINQRVAKNRRPARMNDFKPKAAATPNSVRKANRLKPAGNPEKTPQIFYSLAGTGNWETAGEDLKIVRAELSKAELFALGINLPVENETIKIKTDLLVGDDGRARAIRFAEKF